MASESSVLLPKNVRPVKYNVELAPSFTDFTFKGKVAVSLEVLEATSQLTFHAEDLTLEKATISSNGSTYVIEASGSADGSMEYDKHYHKASLKLASATLQPGSATLSIEYTGILNDNMVGFYRSSYLLDGVKQYMAVTQFEAIEARKALPCWDEPAIKATFTVSMTVPSNMTALSNMHVTEEIAVSEKLTKYTYAESPIMSTYLLAFVVGELDYLETTTAEGVKVRVFTTPGRREEGRFALSVASQILSFFTSYFGIPYPLPKCDLIAIPDFASGAMENWGLITFRETALLVDDANVSAASRQRVAYVVSHELAHQWFGNLVTMKWWDDLWLNEGFATWVGWLGVDHCFPEWDVWTQFVSSDVSVALATDALLSSHPIEVPISDPKDIQQVFDALSYRKGAAVIRQLEATVGPDLFKKGLNNYLEQHKYGNTVTADLWRALEEVSGQPVNSMMSSWTKQMGFPLITVQHAQGGGLVLRQTRFLSAGAPTPEQDNLLWWVPITAVAGSVGAPPTHLKQGVLSTKEESFPDLQEPENGWLKLNPGQSGIYRVNYTASQWKGLSEAIRTLSLPPVDRLGVMADAFALAKAGVLPTSQALELASAYVNETEYTVWSELASNLAEMDNILSNSDCLPKFYAVVRNLFKKIVDSIGWEAKAGESHLTGLLRPLVLSMLARANDEATITKCQRQFQELSKDISAVHPDLRQLVMANAVKHGQQEEFNRVLSIFRSATGNDLKVKCMQALGQTREPALVNEYLKFGFDENEVKAQDALYIMIALAGNPSGRDIAWKYAQSNWAIIYERFRKAHGLLQYMACAPLKGFSTKEKAQEAEDFFAANPVPEARMEISRTLEAIRARAGWLERSEADVSAWLAKCNV